MLDAIVVGAGPAGNETALRLAMAGRSVAVIDYRSNLGAKLCTGIIGKECFASKDIPKDLILHEARSARFMSARHGDTTVLRESPQAYVIDRAAFISGIAAKANDAGAQYITGALVRSINISAERVEVDFRRGGEASSLTARSVVVASGVGSRLPEMAGLSPTKKLLHASQVLVKAENATHVTVMLPGLVPTGHFGWLVPQAPGTALLGVLGKGANSGAEKITLKTAQSKGIAGEPLTDWQHWPVPYGPAPKTAGYRALLVGDAAGQVKPTTGGGIYYSLLSGKLAADTLNACLRRDDLSERAIGAYEAAWKDLLGRELRVGGIARSIYERLDGDAVGGLLQAARASGLLDEEGSFDWHSKLIVKGLGNRMLDAALTPFKAVSGMLSALV